MANKDLKVVKATTKKKTAGGGITLKPKMGLSVAERKTFDLVVAHLKANDCFEDVDVEMVTAYARYVELRRKLMRTMTDPHDLIQVFESGAQQIHPRVTALEKVTKEINMLSSMFGLSPKHREAIKAFAGDDSTGNPLQAWMEQMQKMQTA